MNPLSIRTYYWNNKRKVVPVMGIIALAILAISSTGALTESLFEDARREMAFFEHYSSVTTAQRMPLSEAMIQRLRDHPAITQVVPSETRSVRVKGIFGDQGAPIYFFAPSEQRGFAERMGWGLVEGRWPEPGTNEIVVSKNVLRNRGLVVGDRVGREVDRTDFMIGEWRVVGAFPADGATGGIGDLDYLRERYLNAPGSTPAPSSRPSRVLVAPVEGREAEVAAFLDSLPTNEVGVFHLSRAERELEADLANADMIIWILNGVTIAVLALALGLLNIIFFMQRANEFGLLAAIGYTKPFLVGRTFLEAASTVAIGWGMGVVVSQGIYAVMNALLFTPRGLSPLTILTARVLVFTTPVPLTVTIFSVGIVAWQLWRMDPVAIIERRD